jgi:uncharacterized SAM-binding protein YcdF (DUF218 family)
VFFYLAKIFWFFVQPSGLLLVIVVVATLLLWSGRIKACRWLMIAVTMLVVLGGLLPMSNWLMLPLEQRFPRTTVAGKNVNGIIVLGGAEDGRVWRGRKVHALNEAAERFTEGVALARRFPNAKIAFTGAAVESLSTSNDAADAAREVLVDLGISEPSRVVFETKARDTWENAANLKAQLRPAPEEVWLLVTSAWHMPRAIGAFRAAGFVVEPWPVDYRTAGPWDAVRLFDAPADGLKRLDTAMHEWIGLVSYRVTGRSDALFPAPK